ncbi:mechanosensitive ion channel family protein [Candidatus Saccharibacteria bacterium]|jgi:small-conductance mechanosensitive channel|nr:mechanosensitive ion channel family protein [Candidatus Saccharibacteria bacterium]MBP9131911.1 mechanosensitive ion channel family protein [Candidatus Saccharibacteria bacterium]
MINLIDKLAYWSTHNGIKFLFVVLIGLLIRRFGKNFIEGIVRRSVRIDKAGSTHDKAQREATLIGIFYVVLNFIWWSILTMFLLDLTGVNLGPIVAGAGLAGVTLGFGSQWLIRDIISGMFIIFENQYRVGDVVSLNTGSGITIGTAEEISLRTTQLRDLDGQLHHVPNGNIVVATNLSKDFAGVNLDINVAYDTDIDKLIEVVNNVGAEFKADEAWSDKIIETPSFLRINSFGENGIAIKITGKTRPMEHWAVSGELRKRLKIAFDKAKITLPYPQRVIHNIKD